MNFFKKIFGLELDQQQQKSNPWKPNQPTGDQHNNNFNLFENKPSFSDEESIQRCNREGFDVFTNPLEMHRFFEQQMDEVLKSFGFSDGMPSFGRFFSQHGMPAIEDGYKNPFFGNENQEKADPSTIRDHFLKRGYEHPESQHLDRDVDNEFNIGDLGTILGRTDSQTQTYNQPQIHSSIFGQSMSIKTVRKPDGSLETHKTMRNSDGSEETQIIRKLGEKEYTIIKKRDKNGQEEVIENMLNMDENEKHDFLTPNPSLPKLADDLTRSSLWDKFFK